MVVMLHAAVAEKLDLNPTDLKVADLVNRHGAMTAGQLAEVTGLTSGAITGIIDRLERTGFVTRQRDATDRRVVFIETVPEGAELLQRTFEPLSKAMDALDRTFTREELAVVERYMEAAISILSENAERIRAQATL